MRRSLKASGSVFSRVCAALALVLGAALIVPAPAHAQAVTGTLLGNVTDSSGAAVPGATVVATETRTNISRSTTTNEAGYYIFSSLQNGTYSVDAELQGFKKIVHQNVKVDVNSTIRVDLKLEVGQMTEAVTVSAETPVLQTDRTDTGRIIESKMVSEMPLTFNRNFQGLLVTVPGATRPHRDHSAFFNSQDSLSTEVNGQSRLANNTMIEGLDDNQKTGLLQVIIPAADALETVSVSTSNYDAEFGRSGGAITNVTLKSGTNDLRGSAFFFGNTDATNASDYFSHLKAPTKFANGGFTLGGPIVRNKLFFFGDYQRTIDNQGYVVRAVIPTMAMRNGDFSSVAQRIYDPLTGDVSGANRVAFANNQIPQDRISPIARKLMAFLPEPNIPGAALGQNNFQQAQVREKTTDGFDAKVNYTRHLEGSAVGTFELHAPGRLRPGPVRRLRRRRQRRLRRNGQEHQHEQRRQLDARVQREHGARCARRVELLPQRHRDAGQRSHHQHRGRHPWRQHRRVHERTLADQHRRLLGPGARVLRQPAVGSVRANLEHRQQPHAAAAQPYREVRRRVAEEPRHPAPDAGCRRLARQLQLQCLGHRLAERNRDAQRRRQFHGVVPARLAQRRHPRPEGHRPARHPPLGDGSVRPGQVAGAQQRDRRPRPALGYYDPLQGVEGKGTLANYDPATNTIRVAGYGATSNALNVKKTFTNFAPRTGVSWRLDEKSVLRAGYGASTIPFPDNRYAFNFPVKQNYSGTAANGFQRAGSMATGFPAPVLVSIPTDGIIPAAGSILNSTFDVISPDLREGTLHSWNVAFQRQLPGSFTADIAYVASRGVNLVMDLDTNASLQYGSGNVGRPQFAAFNRTGTSRTRVNDNKSQYNALQVKLDRRFRNGLLVTNSYTFGRSMDLANENTGIGTPIDFDLSWARSDTDRTHNYVLSSIYELPWGPGKKWLSDGVVGKVIGGWQLSGLLVVQSGQALTIGGNGTLLNTPGNSAFVNVNGDQKVLGDKGPGLLYFDPTVYSLPAAGVQGNMKRHSGPDGPGFWNLDGSLFKRFAVGGTKYAEFRIDAYNVTNSVRWANPNTTYSTAAGNTFGQITGTSGSQRSLRFGGRFAF